MRPTTRRDTDMAWQLLSAKMAATKRERPNTDDGATPAPASDGAPMTARRPRTLGHIAAPAASAPTVREMVPLADAIADETGPFDAWEDPGATRILPETHLRRAGAQRGRMIVSGVVAALVLLTATGLTRTFAQPNAGDAHRSVSAPRRAAVIGTPGAPSGVSTAAAVQPGVALVAEQAAKDVVAPPVLQNAAVAGDPCQDAVKFVANIGQWTVPPGCYGTIYSPDPAQYIDRPGFGFCNWWVRVMHPDHPDITENTSYPRGDAPRPGAAVWFDPNVQGATSAGHWAHAEAVSPDGKWVLISEMNFSWRGGGWGKVDYRYIQVGPGIQFVYA